MLTPKDLRDQGDLEMDFPNIRNRNDWSNSNQYLHLHNEGCLMLKKKSLEAAGFLAYFII